MISISIVYTKHIYYNVKYIILYCNSLQTAPLQIHFSLLIPSDRRLIHRSVQQTQIASCRERRGEEGVEDANDEGACREDERACRHDEEAWLVRCRIEESATTTGYASVSESEHTSWQSTCSEGVTRRTLLTPKSEPLYTGYPGSPEAERELNGEWEAAMALRRRGLTQRKPTSSGPVTPSHVVLGDISEGGAGGRRVGIVTVKMDSVRFQ